MGRMHSSPGVPSPSALSVSKIHSTQVCLTRSVPLSGSLSLLGVSSSRYPPALFHAGDALGVLPSGLPPLVRYGTLSSLVTLLPLDAMPTRVNRSRQRRPPPTFSSPGLRLGSSASGFYSLPEAAPRSSVLPSERGRCPLGLCSPLGFSLSLRRTPLPAFSSLAISPTQRYFFALDMASES